MNATEVAATEVDTGKILLLIVVLSAVYSVMLGCAWFWLNRHIDHERARYFDLG